MKISHTVRWYQQPLHRFLTKESGKRAIAVWHRRAGKDEIALSATRELALQRQANYWHALPEYAQGRKALWTAVNPHTGRRRIDEAFPPEIRAGINEQEMLIKLQNGSTWQIVGSDRYNALVGAGIGGVTFSEWALCHPSAWGYIRPMVEESAGWALFITTPRGRNHAKAMYDMAKTRPEWFAELLTVKDTGTLSQESLDGSLAEYCALYGEDIGTAQFQQEYYCSFDAAIPGAFYTREMMALRASDRIREFEPFEGVPVHTAWDIGVRDDTSIWWFQVIGGVPYILDCYTASGVGIDHYADICNSKPWQRNSPNSDDPSFDHVPHDAKVKEWGSGRTRAEMMQRLSLNPRLVPNVSKLDGIQAARETLGLAVFHPRCEETGLSALEQYRREWDEDKRTFQASEVRDWSTHLADAWRYLSLAWRVQPSAARPKPKSMVEQIQAGTWQDPAYRVGPPEERRTASIRI